jgi:hypothetical protein
MGRASLISLVCFAIAIAIGGCGDGGSSDYETVDAHPAANVSPTTPSPPEAAAEVITGPTPMTRADFVALNNQICETAAANLATVRIAITLSDTQPEKIASLLDQSAEQITTTAGALRTLLPPVGDEVFAARLETEREDFTEGLRRLAGAYRAHDVAAVDTGVMRLEREGADLQELALDYGLSACRLDRPAP